MREGSGASGAENWRCIGLLGCEESIRFTGRAEKEWHGTEWYKAFCRGWEMQAGEKGKM